MKFLFFLLTIVLQQLETDNAMDEFLAARKEVHKAKKHVQTTPNEDALAELDMAIDHMKYAKHRIIKAIDDEREFANIKLPQSPLDDIQSSLASCI